MPTRRDFLLGSTATAVGAAARAAAADDAAAEPERRAPHVVLLGDSIFDNKVYVGDGPAVIEQLRAELGERGRATLCARDGDVAEDVAEQLATVPEDATHLVVSVGGNDALGHTHLLDQEIARSSLFLGELAAIQQAFRADYAAMLAAVRQRGLPTAVCTIYDSNFAPPQKALADVALAVWNDVILRCAGEAGVPVVDLRRIFRVPADYANAIEPSPVGGAKLARVLVSLVGEHDFTGTRTVLYR